MSWGDVKTVFAYLFVIFIFLDMCDRLKFSVSFFFVELPPKCLLLNNFPLVSVLILFSPLLSLMAVVRVLGVPLVQFGVR